MIADFIDSHDPRWKTLLLQTRHDFYHLPEYAEVAAAHEGAMPMAFYAEDGPAACLIPLLLRPLPAAFNSPADWRDCMSPYGYSGVLVSSPQVKLHRFLDAFCCTSRARGIVSAFLRLHPLFPLDHGALGKFGEVVRHGQTVYVDLAQPEDSLSQQVSYNHRRNIRRLLRSGFHCRLDDWQQLADFVSIYQDTMRRVAAAPTYFFSRQYFQALREQLGDRVHLVSVMSADMEMAAAGVFIATGSIVQYHLGGTAEKYLPMAPSKLMLDFVRQWAHAGRYGVFHLGGGVGSTEDSLFHFKAGFSPCRGEFHTYRVVMDEAKKTALDSVAESLRRPDVALNDFFPPYRCL
jgi:hypothetical protein